jgi:hypothetical protein
VQKVVPILAPLLVADGNPFDELAYLKVHVDEVMAPRCRERFPEY